MQIHEITKLNENFLKRLATDARNDAFKKATGVDWKTYKLAQTTPLPASAPAATPNKAAIAAKVKANVGRSAAANKASKFGQPVEKPVPAAGAAAFGQMSQQLTKPGSTPEPEVLDPVAKAAQKPAAAKPGDVIDIDARVVPDPAKVAKLPQPAPAQLPKPAAQLPRPATATTVPNYAQTNKVGYQPAAVNAPVATVPTIPGKVATTKPSAPNVNTAYAPVVYRYQGRPLNPSNPADATRIAQLQALGKTSG
jgi:hypothetical protein